jgi:regulator of sigma E protease
MAKKETWIKNSIMVAIIVAIIVILIVYKAFLVALIGLFSINLIVLIHETGHYIAARKSGVDVLVFSIGMGPRLFGIKRKGIDYRISLFPVGGYVRMAGESLFEEALRKNDRSILETPGSLFYVNNFKRIVIAAAGAAFNLISAVIFFFIAYLIGFSGMTGEDRFVTPISNSDPTAIITESESGLRPGDFLLSSREKPINNFSDFRKMVQAETETAFPLTVLRDDKTVNLELKLNKVDNKNSAGVTYLNSNQIVLVLNDSPAEKAGLRKKDTILSINGVSFEKGISYYYLEQAISESDLEVVYQRFDNTYTTVIKRAETPSEEKSSSLTGIILDEFKRQEGGKGFAHALKKAFTEPFLLNIRNIEGFYFIIKSPEVKIKDGIGGPFTITSMVGTSVIDNIKMRLSGGFGIFFWFTGMISSILAIMNLLPIPALDGGMILYCIIESISRRRFQPKTFYRYQFIGFLVIMGLSVFILSVDFNNLFDSLLHR